MYDMRTYYERLAREIVYTEDFLRFLKQNKENKEEAITPEEFQQEDVIKALEDLLTVLNEKKMRLDATYKRLLKAIFGEDAEKSDEQS